METQGLAKACAFLVLVAMVPWQAVNGQATATDPCTDQVTATLSQCLSPVSITQQNFLWFVSNATSSSGQAPADQAGFTKVICKEARDLIPCMFNRIGPLVNTTCRANQALLAKIQQYLMTLDMKCVNPCALSLMQNFQKCYISNSVSPDLFISEKTAGGKYIGTTQADVDLVCPKEVDLLRCLKPLYEGCPDAEPMLRSIGFRMTSYEKAVTFLCTRKSDYLASLACFSQPQPQVDACLQKEIQQVQKMTDDAHVQSWTDQQVMLESCKITQTKVACDRSAWDGVTHPSCTPQVKQFLHEKECTLLPNVCAKQYGSLFTGTCNTPNIVTTTAAPAAVTTAATPTATTPASAIPAGQRSSATTLSSLWLCHCFSAIVFASVLFQTSFGSA